MSVIFRKKISYETAKNMMVEITGSKIGKMNIKDFLKAIKLDNNVN